MFDYFMTGVVVLTVLVTLGISGKFEFVKFIFNEFDHNDSELRILQLIVLGLGTILFLIIWPFILIALALGAGYFKFIDSDTFKKLKAYVNESDTSK